MHADDVNFSFKCNNGNKWLNCLNGIWKPTVDFFIYNIDYKWSGMATFPQDSQWASHKVRVYIHKGGC